MHQYISPDFNPAGLVTDVSTDAPKAKLPWDDGSEASRFKSGDFRLDVFKSNARTWHGTVTVNGEETDRARFDSREEAKAWCEQIVSAYSGSTIDSSRGASSPLASWTHKAGNDRAAVEAQFRADLRERASSLDASPLGLSEAMRKGVADAIMRRTMEEAYAPINNALKGFQFGSILPDDSISIPTLSRLLRLGPDATREQCEGRIRALLTEPESLAADAINRQRRAESDLTRANAKMEACLDELHNMRRENDELRAALADAVLKGRR